MAWQGLVGKQYLFEGTCLFPWAWLGGGMKMKKNAGTGVPARALPDEGLSVVGIEIFLFAQGKQTAGFE